MYRKYISYIKEVLLSNYLLFTLMGKIHNIANHPI